MKLPKFLLGDNSQNDADDLFIVHTEFPRFVINLKNDEIELWETLDKEDEAEWTAQMRNYIQQANAFYDEEIKHYEALE